MQVLFERESREIDVQKSLALNAEELGEIDQEFADDLMTGVLKREGDVKEMVEKYAPDWSLERMDPIARSILIIGAYELLFADDAPPPVVMNESIEIAKEYGTVESGKFVNGVLNAIAHAKDAGK